MHFPISIQTLYPITQCTLPAQMGRCTMATACEAMDAVAAIHGIGLRSDRLPQALVAKLAPGQDFTLAQAQRILAHWKKWTWQTKDGTPDTGMVHQFFASLKV